MVAPLLSRMSLKAVVQWIFPLLSRLPRELWCILPRHRRKLHEGCYLHRKPAHVVFSTKRHIVSQRSHVADSALILVKLQSDRESC